MIIRHLASESERQEYKKIHDIAIGANYGGMLFPDEHYPYENIFGYFSGDKLASALFVIDYDEIKIRNKLFRMGGIEGVVTAPGYRGRGLAKELFHHVFKELNERKQFLSVLFPISHAFYERLGYGLADEHVFYQFELDNIKRKKYPNRTFKMVQEITDDIKFIYNEATKRFNYIAHRFESQWKLKKEQSDFIYVCYNEENKPVGYCCLKFLKDHYLFQHPLETLHVPEVFWVDRSTKHAFIQDFLYSFRDQRKYGSIVLPLNENLIELFHNPITQVRTIKPSSRIRIVNAEEVLSQLSFNAHDFSLIVRIHDEVCDWNNITVRIESANGKTVLINDNAAHVADLELDITSLAQLFVGSRSINELMEFQKAQVKPGMIHLVDKMFPKQNNFFRDFF
ncbi:MAG: enhanced intracellular survival protein Eis [Candidatus Hodarchaeota archaeon]